MPLDLHKNSAGSRKGLLCTFTEECTFIINQVTNKFKPMDVSCAHQVLQKNMSYNVKFWILILPEGRQNSQTGRLMCFYDQGQTKVL